MDMRTFDRVLLIANPTSGGGKAGRWLDRAAAALSRSGCAVDSVLTTRPGDARDAVRRCAHHSPLVIAFGGDGTVNEVLNGADLERCTLGVMPAGTGNVLAKELGMLRRPPSAVRQLLSGRAVRLDVGVCNGRRFACMVGAGVDGHVVRAVHERRRRGLTQFHYLPHVLHAILRPTGWDITVELDGQEVAAGVDQVVVGNTHSYGGPVEMTPAASPQDGLLDVMCLTQPPLPDMVGMVPPGFLRAIHWCPRILYGRGRRVALSSSRSDVPYQVDGEAAGFLPVEVELHKAAARVLAPPGYRGRPRGLADRA